MRVALQALDHGDVQQVRDLLHPKKTRFDDRDLRGFEWRYLLEQSQPQEVFTFNQPGGGESVFATSPDGHSLVTS
jgi:hypothetical protein